MPPQGYSQRPLTNSSQTACLPVHYEPSRPAHLYVDRIYLAKGSSPTPERREFVARICALYPDAERINCPETPHNRTGLQEREPLARHAAGKRTLVFGVHASALRFSSEEGNTCPNYWHFSPYGFCPHGCKYCYLAGTPAFWHSPTLRIFVNLGEILRAIDGAATQAARPTAFYLGKLQDGLALDPLTAYSTVLVPFFARHKFARQVILTKSAQVERLLDLDHAGHTILSWSLNPPEIVSHFEENVPSAEERLQAMKRCAERGYPLRAVLMPIIPVDDWETIYSRFLGTLLAAVPISRLTLGGICIYRNALALMERKLGRSNAISLNIAPGSNGGTSRDCGIVAGAGARQRDGRARYAAGLRVAMYSRLLRIARELRPDLELALCLEEPSVLQAVNLQHRLGLCNCVL